MCPKFSKHNAFNMRSVYIRINAMRKMFFKKIFLKNFVERKVNVT